MRTRFRALALFCAILPGCADDSVRPPLPDPASNAFYPLAVGTAWTYASARSVRFIAENGGDTRPPIDQRGSTARTIVTRETIDEQVWSVEEERFLLAGSPDTVITWRRYRELPTGLYRADLPSNIPPGGAADVDSLAAARRLAYPRDTGAVWPLFDGDPAATGTLVAIDTLATDVGTVAAFRVEYRLPGDGPLDHRRFWYAACGIVRSETHTEIVAVDVSTGERVRIVSTVTDEIVSVEPGCCCGGITRRGQRTEARPAPARW
jgi:hypothetical protein